MLQGCANQRGHVTATRIYRAVRLTNFVALAPTCAIVPTLWARASVPCDKLNADDFTKAKWLIAARNGARCRAIRHAILAPMQYKAETPTKSTSELLALFMRQAAVELTSPTTNGRRFHLQDVGVRRTPPARSK